MARLLTIENNEEVIETKTKKKSSVWEWVRFGLLIFAILIIIPNTFSLVTVSGYSMFPTLDNGNLLLEEKLSKHFTSPELGDVVIINDEIQGYKVVKRVIGVGGDTIEIKEGIVYVNQEALPEVMTDGKPEDLKATTVPRGHIFVMGDNRAPGESIDSRDPSFGPIPTSAIDGYALLMLSPFKSIPKPIKLD